ncbi:MAG: hypothetical protein Unbinned3329contig1000_52 [Prokaryotic dsDNA virus sp.]|jgi:hypothetical protein|nr:MAG: hypothetical protein Unbinned3329contig1000_52 [Prokaryotic dsDNA virus sp.]|tara:strand:- start:1155 stop:1334 length:180 start_codon:yes stop_codon:yes gene_type:complete
MNKIVIPQKAIDDYNKRYADKIAKYKASIPSNIPYYLDEDAIYEQYLKNVKASECPRKE